MSHTAYPAYSLARHPWLNQLPSHWDSASIRLIAKRYSGGTPDKSNSLFWVDGMIPWLNSGEVNQGVITKPTTHITEDALLQSSAKWIPPNAIILALAGQGKTKGMAGITTFSTTCNQSMAAVLFEVDHPKYMYWWLNSQYRNIRGMASDDARDGLNLEMVATIPCPRPPEQEQKQIAAFLDWKISQIDALIAKKQTLLQKLKEKRLAVITQAVTKGLNPDAPMRDSGIAWLGEVPAHWKLPALALRYKVELGKMLDEKQITKRHLIPYLRNVDVQWGKINFKDLPEIDIAPHEYSRYAIEEGDVLVCEGGEVGRAAIVGTQTSVFGFQKALHRLRATTSDESPQFIFYTMMWAANTGVFNEEGNSTIAHLTAEKLRRYRFPQPPLAEQAAIVERLGIATEKIQRLLDKTESAIDRLTEYRSALITAATTGKIDVRNVAIPAHA